jgi:[ribosomal protein S5]-alanine N-acetyltransferase
MRVIEAGSLRLEPQTAMHAAEMFAVLSDPAIYEYENEPPASVEWLHERFSRLETRTSSDGRERWLNWVIRIPSSELIGYVQATIHPGGRANIAYVLSSAYWGHGHARRATEAMIAELACQYGVRDIFAVLKDRNLRSVSLLERLGFALAAPEQHAAQQVEADEVLFCRTGLRP